MFFWKHTLKLDWQWLNMVKAPKVKTIPDILTPGEIEQLIDAAEKLRYRVFLLTTYSMGLRLEEALSLQVGDIVPDESAFIFVGEKAIKIAWSLCLIAPCTLCVCSGKSIAIRHGSFLTTGDQWQQSVGQPPIWTQAVRKAQ